MVWCASSEGPRRAVDSDGVRLRSLVGHSAAGAGRSVFLCSQLEVGTWMASFLLSG